MPGLQEAILRALFGGPAGQQVPPPQMNAQGMAPQGTGGIMDILSRAGQGMANDVSNFLPVSGMTGGGGVLPQITRSMGQGAGKNLQQMISRQQTIPIPPQATAQPPVPPSQTIPGSATGSQNKETGFDWKNLAYRLGIPLGAAIAGTANPGLLPQASGLATGYQSSVEKNDEANRRGKIKIFDEETGQVVDTGQIYKATDKILTKSKTKEDFRDAIIKEFLGIEPPPSKVGEAAKVAGEKIRVINSQGQAGSIPKEQLEEALKNGYSLAR